MKEEIICIREVNENIRRCELGMSLTKPLRLLNNFCEFRKKFEEMDKIRHPALRCIFCHKEINHKGYCSERCKKRRREYEQKYYQKPEVKKRKREYQQKPEVKKRKREWYLKNREKILKRRKEKEK